MKTLFLLDGLGIGGSQRKSVRLVNELSARGTSVHLAYLVDVATLLPQVDSRVPTICLERRSKLSVKALRNLRRYVEAHDISLLFCMNLYPLLYAAALKLLWRRSLKIILAVNITDFDRKRDGWFMLAYSPLMRLTRWVIYGCEYQKAMWERRYWLRGVPSRVIYNGVDAERFDPRAIPRDVREQLGITDSFVVGSVGRLTAEKNHGALLKAAAELIGDGGRLDVVLAGSGPERERLGQLATDLRIAERVHFLGPLDDVRGALAALDVFVLPSVAVETFSNAALEAMAMAAPVVLSDIAGAAEMVVDGVNGFLYEKNDLKKLTARLRQLRSDPALRRRLGTQARDTVVSRFNDSRMIADYEAVLADS